jgi:hypothetical protein
MYPKYGNNNDNIDLPVSFYLDLKYTEIYLLFFFFLSIKKMQAIKVSK